MANVKRANTSGITKSGVAIADVPDAPTIGSATAGAESATVTYTAATTGGTATTFTATSTPGSVTGTGSSPITVAGLTGETSYTFTVRASNSTGNSPFSSASNSITPTVATSYESIATVTVGGGGTASAAFTSIPGTYKHLQVRLIARTTATGATDGGYLTVRFNDISTAASYYGQHWLQGNGTAAAAGADGTATNLYMERISTGQQTASVFGAGVVDILDYTDTNKNRVTRSLVAYDNNGSGQIYLSSGMLLSTPAITKIEFFPNDGNFAQYSHFALYGIKGA